jgi:hypothetical protein
MMTYEFTFYRDSDRLTQLPFELKLAIQAPDWGVTTLRGTLKLLIVGYD